MNICKVFVPYGALGTGISEEAFANGVAMKPDIISVDGGSTDSGPYYLGNGKCKYAREALKTDTRRMIKAAHDLNIPITIGSCGTCGVDEGVDFMEEICREILSEEGFSAKIVKVYTEQDPDTIHKESITFRGKQNSLRKTEGCSESGSFRLYQCRGRVAKKYYGDSIFSDL